MSHSNKVNLSFLRQQLLRITPPNNDVINWRNAVINSNFNTLRTFYRQIRDIVLTDNTLFTQNEVRNVIDKYIEMRRDYFTEQRLNVMKQELRTELNNLNPNVKELQKKFTVLADNKDLSFDRKQYLDLLKKMFHLQHLGNIGKVAIRKGVIPAPVLMLG